MCSQGTYMAVDFEKIKMWNDKIKEALAERPEFQPMQDELDRRLKLAGNNHDRRQQIVEEMMCSKWSEVVPAWEDAWAKKEKE